MKADSFLIVFIESTDLTLGKWLDESLRLVTTYTWPVAQLESPGIDVLPETTGSSTRKSKVKDPPEAPQYFWNKSLLVYFFVPSTSSVTEITLQSSPGIFLINSLPNKSF